MKDKHDLASQVTLLARKNALLERLIAATQEHTDLVKAAHARAKAARTGRMPSARAVYSRHNSTT